LLNLLYLVLKLDCHLVDLGTLHVLMVNGVASDWLGHALLSSLSLEVLLGGLTLSEFVYHELLHLDDVDNVEGCLDVVEGHDAELAGDRAVAVLSQDYKEAVQELTSHLGLHVGAHMELVLHLEVGVL